MRRTYVVGRSIRPFEDLEQRLTLSAAPPSIADVSVASSDWTNTFLDHFPGDGGYSIPSGSTQTTPLPWSNLDRITITFSEDVNVAASHLSLSGVTHTEYEIDGFSYDPVTMTATWELATPIADQERLHLDLDSDGINPIRDLDGNLLDGEWIDHVSQFPSGSNGAGGDFEFSFNVLVADTDGTIGVDNYDALSISYKIGTSVGDSGYDAFYDLDGSGAIDHSDWQAAVNLAWTTLPIGNPAGWANDAPSADKFDYLSVSDREADNTIALDAVFADLEDSSANLTYSIAEHTNPGLFDTIWLNPSTATLTLNAAATGVGRSVVTVQATDSGGLSVQSQLTVDVGTTNQSPQITLFPAYLQSGGKWTVEGTVSDDDDDVTGMIVELTQLFDQRVVVRADGTFSYGWLPSGGASSGVEQASTLDQHGAISPTVSTWIGT